jgi:hypothetical protein
MYPEKPELASPGPPEAFEMGRMKGPVKSKIEVTRAGAGWVI